MSEEGNETLIVGDAQKAVVSTSAPKVYTLSISQWLAKHMEAEKVARELEIEIQVALKLVLSEKYRSWQVIQLKKLTHPSNRWAFTVLQYFLQNPKVEWDDNKFPFKAEENGIRPVLRLRVLFSYDTLVDGVIRKVKPNWGTYNNIAEAAQTIGWIE